MSKTQANRTNVNRPTHPPDRMTSRASLEAARAATVVTVKSIAFTQDMADRARSVLPPRDATALRTLERIAAAKAKGDVYELRRIAKRAEEAVVLTGSSRAVCLLDAANDAIRDFCKQGAWSGAFIAGAL